MLYKEYLYLDLRVGLILSKRTYIANIRVSKDVNRLLNISYANSSILWYYAHTQNENLTFLCQIGRSTNLIGALTIYGTHLYDFLNQD